MQTFAKMYNLTLSNELSSDKIRHWETFGISFGMGFLPTQKDRLKTRVEVYRIYIENYGFVVVTDPPSFENNFKALLSPFDSSTWICLLLSVVAITVTIQFRWVL